MAGFADFEDRLQHMADQVKVLDKHMDQAIEDIQALKSNGYHELQLKAALICSLGGRRRCCATCGVEDIGMTVATMAVADGITDDFSRKCVDILNQHGQNFVDDIIEWELRQLLDERSNGK